MTDKCDSLRSIGRGAFSGCEFLREIKIPDGVIEISSGAFSGCTRLKSVTLPDSITALGDYAFSGCSSLTSLILPDSVSSFGEDAFNGRTSLENLVILEGSLDTITGRSFIGCTNLKTVTIPTSVKSIGNSAFLYCDNLKCIYYAGTKEQWDAIEMQWPGWSEDITVYYNCTPPEPVTVNGSGQLTGDLLLSTEIPASGTVLYAACYDENHKFLGAEPVTAQMSPDGEQIRLHLTGKITPGRFQSLSVKVFILDGGMRPQHEAILFDRII